MRRLLFGVLILAAAIPAGALAAGGRPRAPHVGPVRQAAALALAEAQQRVARRWPACIPAAPSFVAGAVPDAAAAAFGVFRRPQTAGEAAVAAAPGPLLPLTTGMIGASVRTVRSLPDGSSVSLLVAVAPRAATPVPASCRARLARALRRVVRHAAPAVRRAARRQATRLAAATPPEPGPTVWMSVSDPQGWSAGGGGLAVDVLRRTGAAQLTQIAPRRTLVAVVVPDGVAGVRLTVAGPGGTTRAEVPASDNVAVLTVHRRVAGLRLTGQVWHDAAGAVVASG